MPFIPRDPRQYRPGNPGQEWLDQLRSGGRLTASLPLLEATGAFTDRMGAPGQRTNWRDRQATGQRARAASGSYLDQPGPMQPPTASQRIPAARSAIASLRPGGGQAPTPGPGGYAPDIGRAAPGYGYAEPAAPAPAPAPAGAGGFGIGDYLGQPGLGTALLGAGGAMMEAAGRPGATFGGSLGTGLKGFATERARYQTSEAARQQALLKDQTPPQDLTARQNAIRARYEMRGFTDPIRLQQLLAMAGDEDGYKAALVELEAPEAAGQTDVEIEQEKLAWYLGLSSEEQASYNLMRRNPPAAGTTVTIEGDTPVGPAQEGMDTYIQGVYNGRSATFDNVIPALQNVKQTLLLVDDPRFKEVAGVWSGNPIADALLRFQGDPELLAMLGTFERLGSDRALAILRNFTGAKSNFEFQVSEKMAAKDRSMTPAELRAMLELMRRAHIQEAVRWAQSMVYMGEDVQIEGDYAAVQRRFMSDAQGILDQYGEEERSWRQAVDPFGIGRGRS
jgi:hypothetical protein